jgi:ferric-dicitrate binding protein FerR (iron transport regulator)
VAVGFHAHAYATAAELNRREQLNELKTSDLAAYGAVDSDVGRARAFYATAGVLAVAGAGLLLWDLHLERKGLAIDPGQATLRF